MRRLLIIVCVCLGFGSLENALVSTVTACPLVVQEESDSLLDLLVKYNTQLLSLGQDHPEVSSLRRDIDARVEAGEKCDREKVATMLEKFRQQYRAARNEVGGSHPNAATVVSYIAMLSELLARETEPAKTSLDEILKVKDNWVSGVLYVPSGRFIGYADHAKPDDTEIAISKGSDDGLKVGMHLYVHAYDVDGETKLSRDKTFVIGQVAGVEPKQAQIKLLSSLPSDRSWNKIFCTQPGFNIGSLIITVRFDEETWKNRPLMNAFLGDLLHNCSGEERAKLHVLVPDSPRSECQIDLLPIGPKGHTEDQLRTLKALDSFIKEQPYLTNVKLNSVTSFDKATPPSATPADEVEAPRNFPDVSEQSGANGASSGKSHLLRRRLKSDELKKALRNWQTSELLGIRPDTLPEVITSLRTKANELEIASTEKANEVRRTLAAKPPKTADEIEKAKNELRTAVDEAFNARQQLQMMEFTSLTMQIQTTLQSLNKRSENQNEIVNRRIDDLLNPNYRWDSTSLRQKSVSASQTLLSDNCEIGWKVNNADGVLELILQLPNDKANSVEADELKASIPDLLKGRYSRIVVRFGSSELPRSPSDEEIKATPRLPDSPPNTSADSTGYWWRLDNEGQQQIVVAISADQQHAMKQQNQEYVVNLPGGIAHQASTVVLQLSDAIKNDPATKMGSVSGQVTLRGKPITGTVVLTGDQLSTVGTINESGKFQTGLVRSGKYKVSIKADSDVAAKTITAKYKDPLTTPIEIDVAFDKHEFQFFEFELGK